MPVSLMIRRAATWAIVLGIPIALIVYYNLHIFVHSGGLIVVVFAPFVFWEMRNGFYPPEYSILLLLGAQLVYYTVVLLILQIIWRVLTKAGNNNR